MTVGLVTNVYERTYRQVLSPGYFRSLEQQNRRSFDQVVVLLNNIDDEDDARRRAQSLVSTGEIDRFEWVNDWRDVAIRSAGLRRWDLRRRPYLTDFGLIMPLVVDTEWILGWDAETRLAQPNDWVSTGIALITSDPRVFHVSLNWVPNPPDGPVIDKETVKRAGEFAYGYGFSDHVFLLRRQDLLRARFRNFSPAAVVRHAPHPYTFEYRMESYQRAARKYGAILTSVTYETNYSPRGVLLRTRGSFWDVFRIRALWQFGWSVLDRLPENLGPRFKRYPTE